VHAIRISTASETLSVSCKLRVLRIYSILFTVSDFPAEAAGRYLCWGGEGLISPRDTEAGFFKFIFTMTLYVIVDVV
jgi:hypothetical protein